MMAAQVIEARSAGFAHRRQLGVGVGGHGVVHDAVFFQAGQCLVVLLARELVVIDVLGILLEAQIQVDDVLVLGLILAGFVSGIGGGNLIFAQVALVKRVVSVGRADRPTGVSRLAGVHCDAFRGEALRVAGTELDQLLFRDFAVLENLGGFSATGVLDFCDFVPIRRVRGVGVRIAADGGRLAP